MSRGNGELHWIEFEGVIERVTDRALQVRGAEGGMEPFWLPQSQVEWITYARGGDSRELRAGEQIEAIEMPWWLAKEKGLV